MAAEEEDHEDEDDVDESSGLGRVQIADDHHHLIQVFQDLELKASAQDLDRVTASIESRLAAPSARASNHDKSEQNGGMLSWRVFERTTDAFAQGALLFLVPDEKRERLYVSNIVPTGDRSFGFDRYNEILREFAESFAIPTAKSLGLSYELSEEWVDFAAGLDVEAFKALVAASLHKPGTHPYDRERWMKFILAARSSSRDLDTTLLSLWLEAEGFSPGRAQELSAEFEFAQDLLDLYRR